MKKITIISIFIIIAIFIFSSITLAYNLELILSANKNTVNVGDKVTVTLTLSKGMQAADFILNYDSSLLRFEETSLEKNFYNAQEPGKIVCSWFNTNDTISFDYTFTAISSGTANFTTTTENFYDGNLQAASSYNEGNLNITLLSSTNLPDNPSIPNNGNNNNNNNSNGNSNNQNTQQETPNNIPSINNNSNTQSTNSNQLTNNNNTNKPSTTTEKLPQTGDNTIVFITMGMILTIFAFIFKMKWNKLRDI